MSYKIKRRHYAEMFGPTTGDKVRLGDTALILEVEKDHTFYGDECKFGGGKVIREGMGQAAGIGDFEALDCVITNALVLDWTGIYKADIGLKQGRIAAIGKAGNPDVMDAVTQGMIVGVTTEVIAGEGLILTAGGLDTHIHFICPQQSYEAIAAGLTTMIGGGTGPAVGTCATTCTPGSFNLRTMLQAVDGLPLNFGFTGKGNTALPAGLSEQIAAGAIGLKLHEDWGTTPAAIDCCLRVAEEMDVQVTIHTDTLNESGFVESTVAAFKGRTIHTYHSEGAGGGHAPDIIRICGEPNVLPSSTNPTRPYTVNTLDEHLDMLMVCHHLDSNLPEDVAFAESRIRGETIAAEDILHDLGAISMMSSDSQAMGRIGEVITRTWQTADKMKRQRGRLSEEEGNNDNLRIKRYLSKYTINPAIAHGIGHLAGSIEVGKLADLVLWKPAFFGAKPEMVIKGGIIAWAQMGDPNASIPTPQPAFMRPMFGSFGRAVGSSSVAFVSQACQSNRGAAGYDLTKQLEPVKGCRGIGKQDMKWNSATPRITVDPETYEVRADGELLTCAPAMCSLSLNDIPSSDGCPRESLSAPEGRLAVPASALQVDEWVLWQFVDSAFPAGAYAHSSGLEAAAQYGAVRNGPELSSFIEASLAQLGQGTIPFLTSAHSNPQSVAKLDQLSDAWITNDIANRASRLQGRGLLCAVERAFGPFSSGETPLRLLHGHLAPVFGYVSTKLGIPSRTMLRCFVFSHIRGLTTAAVRLNVVGPFEAQRIQHRLAETGEETVHRCRSATLDDLAQTAPLLDLWQGSQERLACRLFQS